MAYVKVTRIRSIRSKMLILRPEEVTDEAFLLCNRSDLQLYIKVVFSILIRLWKVNIDVEADILTVKSYQPVISIVIIKRYVVLLIIDDNLFDPVAPVCCKSEACGCVVISLVKGDLLFSKTFYIALFIIMSNTFGSFSFVYGLF